jgi:hypothetical protein
MGIAEGRLVATVGLAGRESCVRWFFGSLAFPLAAALRGAGVRDLCELRLLSVDPPLQGHRFGRPLAAAAYSRAFLAPDGEAPAVIHCARPGLFRALRRCLGVTAHLVAAPGASPDGPELRLVLPEIDVPPDLYRGALPAEGRVRRAGGAARG